MQETGNESNHSRRLGILVGVMGKTQRGEEEEFTEGLTRAGSVVKKNEVVCGKAL